MPIHAHFFPRAILTRKVGQTDLVFGVRSELYVQDYKSLCAAVTITATLFNIQTDRQTHTHTHTQTTFGHLI